MEKDKPTSSSASSSSKDSRDALIDAAKTVFAKHSYSGATVKEIAETAGVNISLVSYHFDGKEGLYRACLEQFGHTNLANTERILKNPTSPEDFKVRLKVFLEEVFDSHVREKELVSIIHRECISDNPITRDIFLNVFVKIFQRLVEYVASAQRQGFLRADIEAHISTTLFWGGLMNVCRMDQLQKEVFGVSISDPVHREKVIDHAIQSFLEGNRSRQP